MTLKLLCDTLPLCTGNKPQTGVTEQDEGEVPLQWDWVGNDSPPLD